VDLQLLPWKTDLFDHRSNRKRKRQRKWLSLDDIIESTLQGRRVRYERAPDCWRLSGVIMALITVVIVTGVFGIAKMAKHMCGLQLGNGRRYKSWGVFSANATIEVGYPKVIKTSNLLDV